MFGRNEIGINTTVCGDPKRGLRYLAQATLSAFEKIVQGQGLALRFELTSNLAAGSNAAVSIMRFQGGGFSHQRGGTVFDEEPGGLWSGVAGDQGWCTGRDGRDGEYSIICMSPLSGLGGIGGGNINSAWLAIFAAALNNTAGFALATLAADLTGGASVSISGFDWKGELPLRGSVPTTASNPFAHRGLSGDQVMLFYNAEDSAWTIADVDKHVQTVVTSVSLGASSLDVTTVTAALEYGAAPASSSPITTTTTCS